MVETSMLQIGKNGITTGIINSLNLAFKHHKQVRISVLKSQTRSKKEMENLVLKIEKELKIPIKSRIIGFTIILIRQSKWKTKYL